MHQVQDNSVRLSLTFRPRIEKNFWIDPGMRFNIFVSRSQDWHGLAVVSWLLPLHWILLRVQFSPSDNPRLAILQILHLRHDTARKFTSTTFSSLSAVLPGCGGTDAAHTGAVSERDHGTSDIFYSFGFFYCFFVFFFPLPFSSLYCVLLLLSLLLA